MNEILAHASRLTQSGLSVIPIKPDGTKAPDLLTWKPFQGEIADSSTLENWFESGTNGLAVIGGEVSGGLEIIDFDDPETARSFGELIRKAGRNQLVERLPLVGTPTGGFHLYYRCQSKVEGNQKLAQKIGPDDKPVVQIETRGEGGYVLAPGSPAKCHELEKPYELKRGDLANIPIITIDEREFLLNTARSLNEYVKPTKQAPTTFPSIGEGDRPGDRFNATATWREVLEPHGWTAAGHQGETTHWRRPGKKQGASATTNHNGNDLFYCFSSNGSPFEPDTGYEKFTAYTLLNHGGDFEEATLGLVRQGYGSPEETRPNAIEYPGQARSEPDPKTQSKIPNLLRQGFHDAGNAERLEAIHGRDLRYCYEFRKWLIFDGQRWVRDTHGIAEKWAKETIVSFLKQAVATENESAEKFARGSLNVNRINGMLFLARCELPIASEDLDAHPYLLNCLNGTLDLKTGELREHQREDYLTKLVHFEYKPQAECPRFKEFLYEIMGSSSDSSEAELERIDQLVEYLQKAFGSACTGDTSEKKVFCFFGGGDNGKTTLLEAIRHVIAEYSHQVLIDSLMARTMQQTNASMADLADLRGARFVTTSEGERGQRLAEARLKYLTAGMGEIKTCRKYENPIKFPATHKLFIDSNYKPRVRGTDDAIWSRLKPIPFTVTIPRERIDRSLLTKLKDEGEGILAWLIEGYQKWQREGLSDPKEVNASAEGWQEENNPLRDFIADVCILDLDRKDGEDSLFCRVSTLSKAYRQWAQDNGEKYSLSPREFGNRLEHMGCKGGTKRISGKRQRVWLGIGLNEEVS